MTKMPDKIYAIPDTSGVSDEHKMGWYHGHQHKDNTRVEYVRSDLIPQPVTDEAKAKALDDIHLWERGEVLAAEEVLDNNLNTIKAALSQPITVQDELAALNGTLDSANETNRAMGKRLKLIEAENADLRRAVVDLVEGLRSLDEFDPMLGEHYATIAKAKAVQE